MKFFYFVIIIFFANPLAYAQNEVKDTAEKIHEFAEIKPEYPGGDYGLQEFLRKNLKVPLALQVSKKAWAKFVVEKTGEITNIEIIVSQCGDCIKEFTRVIKLMPKWKPGENNGQKVRVRSMVSVHFAVK